MAKPTLLVLAAGMGSRYGGLKQLDAVGPAGETIMDYSVHDALVAGFGKVVFVIRREFADAFHEAVGGRYRDRVAVDFAYQEIDALPGGFDVPDGRVKPWGTGHAILVARGVVDGPFAVINADDFYGQAGFAAAADHLTSARDTDAADYAMVGYRLSNTLSEHGSVSRGICQRSADGILLSVTETHGIQRDGNTIVADDPTTPGKTIQLTGEEIVSMNLWCFTPSIFKHLDEQFRQFLAERGSEEKSEFYIPSVVTNLIDSRKARVRVLTSDASWFGVTFREDKPAVQQAIAAMVNRGDYTSPLWS